MQPCQKFVLIASPRTGSQALNRHLNQYDGMVMHGEVFNSTFVGLRNDYHEKMNLPREAVEVRDADPEQFIARIFDDPVARFVGFHLFPEQTRPAILPVLEDDSVKKLWLVRNPVASFLSLLEAEASGVWTVDASEPLPAGDDRKKVRFDIDRFNSYLNELNLFRAKIKSVLFETGQPYFPIHYGDIADPLVGNAIIAYLGGSQRLDRFKTETLKSPPRPFAERIENYWEFTAYFRAISTEALYALG
ncbi:MAG: hypothetical protein EOS58_24975 [Mesorhizobium sp.]|uniref:hypothetical protein n=1 Tax=unclassified Mesorhizobium TaxID=325217 RepID=UPI000F765040|nr:MULTISPECIES: hypothetical protein [unclassified Mesorhizobium]AZO48152.1 hypothetical protein EJ073_10235 [Mesorhizobium sp. M4B.F.Ca.ET.058.02.1.1]RUX48637.1 hypothetical protein EOA33_14965 [Mesorhizobium sp. M4A.F.Ca.ET.050.02.1.1]RWD01663.1 MAG: hypothetical protein EOS58_24975 [Mesorhizobium sp.]RWD15170.1 MAG: hypothetical protein EOS74_11820 [Mesorhizobium sp.]RWD26280.1 MAG: hypothetical protein EOS22_16855 [Mesorhizobium sp.]